MLACVVSPEVGHVIFRCILLPADELADVTGREEKQKTFQEGSGWGSEITLLSSFISDEFFISFQNRKKATGKYRRESAQQGSCWLFHPSFLREAYKKKIKTSRNLNGGLPIHFVFCCREK